MDALEFYFDDAGEEHYDLFKNVGENGEIKYGIQNVLWDRFGMNFSFCKCKNEVVWVHNYMFEIKLDTNLLNGDCLSLVVQGFMAHAYRVSVKSLDVVWNYDFRSNQIIGESLGLNNRQDICFLTREFEKALNAIQAFIDRSRPRGKCAQKQK